MSPIERSVLEFLREDDWRYERLADRPVILTEVQGKQAHYRCCAQVQVEEERFLFYVLSPNAIPEDRLAEAQEFITRANYGLPMGNFELDLSDGELRFKTSVDIEGGELTTTMVKNIVYGSIACMERYFPGLMTVVFGHAVPRDTIEQIEAMPI